MPGAQGENAAGNKSCLQEGEDDQIRTKGSPGLSLSLMTCRKFDGLVCEGG